MKALFADASYYVALLSRKDSRHAKACEWSRRWRGRIVVTDYVLLELGNTLARGTDRKLFVRLLKSLRNDPDTEIVPASRDLFDRGLALFAERPDKEWSLTDCISFVIMGQAGIREALTTDHHFKQAGFTILLN